MGLVNVNDLQEGMVVQNQVSNRHGNALLKKGETVTQKNIVLLKSWGITEVDIESFDKQQVEEIDKETLPPEITASIDKEIEGLFPAFQDNPLMERLYGIVKKAKMKAAVENESGSSNEAESN